VDHLTKKKRKQSQNKQTRGKTYAKTFPHEMKNL